MITTDTEIRCPRCGAVLAYRTSHYVLIHAGRRRYLTARATATCQCREMVELGPVEPAPEPAPAPTDGDQP